MLNFSHNPGGWIEDVNWLVSRMRAIHPNLYYRHGAEIWTEVIEEFKARLPGMAWHEMVAGVLRLAALAGDGHTTIFDMPEQGPGFDRRYPVDCWCFSDGMYVIRTLEGCRELFAGRIKCINGFSVEEVTEALRPYISAENELWMLHRMPGYLCVPGILHAAGLSESVEAPLELTIVDDEGYPSTIEIEAIAAGMEPDWCDADDYFDAVVPKPLYRRSISHYTFDFDETDHVLYVDHRRVRDAESESLAAFSQRLFDFVETHPVEKFVLDIRRNAGGNLSLNQPLVHGLIANKRLNQPGKLFVIVGRGTFSAAMHLASYIERETHALFVGEPTGSTPNHYGDPEPICLPHTGLTLFCSTVFWQNSEPWDVRPWIFPDLPAPLSFADYLQRRDPALEAIRGCQAGANGEHRLPWTNWRRPSQERAWPALAQMAGINP